MPVLVVQSPELWFNRDRLEGFGVRIGYVGPQLVVVLPRTDLIVGRAHPRESDAAFLRIMSDAVTRRHCAFRFVDSGYELEDLGSTCGTPVNGRKVFPGRVRLKPGDSIHIGRHLMQLADGDPLELTDRLGT